MKVKLEVDVTPEQRAAIGRELGTRKAAPEEGVRVWAGEVLGKALAALAESDDESTGSMTAGELADFLSGFPRDRKVILEKDAEGNGYSPLASADEGLYVADSTYSGEMHPTPENVARWVAEGQGQEGDWGEWTDADDGVERVIVLGPVN